MGKGPLDNTVCRGPIGPQFRSTATTGIFRIPRPFATPSFRVSITGHAQSSRLACIGTDTFAVGNLVTTSPSSGTKKPSEEVASCALVSKLLRLHSHSLGANSFFVARNSQTYAPQQIWPSICLHVLSLSQFNKTCALPQKFKKHITSGSARAQKRR